MEVIENPRLSTVVDVITKEVTKSLQKCISQDVIIENQETWRHLSNIPQVRKLINRNIELQTELAVEKKPMQDNELSERNNTLENALSILRTANSKLQQKVIKFNEVESKMAQQENLIETQKILLIKLREQVSELKKPLTINTNLDSNKISLEVEEIEIKSDVHQAIEDSGTFYENVHNKKENQVIDNSISITNSGLYEESTEASSSDTSDNEDAEDELMLEHWEREKLKLEKLKNTYGVYNLETKDDNPTNISDNETHLDIKRDNSQSTEKETVQEEEEKKREVEEIEEVEEEEVVEKEDVVEDDEEEVEESEEEVEEVVEDEEESEEEAEEVEEITLRINGKKQKVYKSDNGNIYQILEDDDAGDLIGTVNNKGKFIPL